MRTHLSQWTIAALLLALQASVQAAEREADLIIFGGPIVTVNDLQPDAEAVAVRGGRIAAVGYRDEVMKLKGPKTRLMDLGGKTLIPGLVDAHGHVFGVGIQALSANMLPAPDGEGNDIPALQRLLKEWAAKNEKATSKVGWIIGFGYDDSQLKEQRHPTREELDAVSTTLPVVIIHQSGHMGVMNSKGLELAGYSAATKDPAGGAIRRKPGSQEPAGLVEEAAFFGSLGKILGRIGPQEGLAVVKAGSELYASYGYTTAQEGRSAAGIVAALAAAGKRGDLKIDVVSYPDISSASEVIKPPLHSRSYTNRVRIGGAKTSLDGSVQGRTAFLTQPYVKPPAGQKEGYLGYGAMTDDQVKALIDKAYAQGWQILVHVNGDAAADQMISAVRAAQAKYGKADRRTVAIHSQTIREDQVAAFKELGIIPSFFTMHTYYWGDWHLGTVLGPQRAPNISPTGWTHQRGMVFTTHHVAPVALPDSMRVWDSTVNRVTRTGKLLGGDQRVSPLVALKSNTIYSAYQHFEEKDKGSIEPGKLADFVVLDQNPLTIDPMKIAQTRVIETIKEGRTVYSRPTKSAAVPAGCAQSAACFALATHTLAENQLIDIHTHAPH